MQRPVHYRLDRHWQELSGYGLGYQACQDGYWVMYVNTAKLIGHLKLAKAKGTILATNPSIARLKNLLYDEGAVYASMSGSGSAVFGIFDSAPTLDVDFDSETYDADFSTPKSTATAATS